MSNSVEAGLEPEAAGLRVTRSIRRTVEPLIKIVKNKNKQK